MKCAWSSDTRNQEKIPWHGITHHLPQQRTTYKAKSSLRKFVETVFVITKARFLWILLDVVTLKLISVTVIYFRRYGKPFLAKALGCWATTSPCCRTTPGPILPRALWLVQHWGWKIMGQTRSHSQFYTSLWTFYEITNRFSYTQSILFHC